VSARTGPVALKTKKRGCCEYAGCGDTHNDLRSAASLLPGVGLLVVCLDGFYDRVMAATVMRIGKPLSTISSRIKSDCSRSKISS